MLKPGLSDCSKTSGDTRFSTEHLVGDLKRLSVRGGTATFAGQGAKFVLNLGSTMILARLLTPQDFGLIAMVTAVTGFVLTFKDLGLSMATVQRVEINHGQISTLFWVNVAISVGLTLITLALAPVIAWFYRDPRLLGVTAALSIAFIFGGLTVQHQALLRRQMRLGAVATIEVSSLAAGVLTALVCAWAGLGYWALVWMQIAVAFTDAVGVWIASGWRPGLPVRRSGVRSMLAFGGYLTGFGVVNYAARNLDNILIGRYWGAGPLGLYSKAYSLLLLPLGQIVAPMTSVAVPALSRLQSQPERYRAYYLKALKIVAYLTMPLVVAMGVLSSEVVLLVLGPNWIGAAPIFRILAITALFQPIVSTTGWIYVSLGQTRRMAAWGAVACSLIVISFVIGLPWGTIGVATSYAVITVLLVCPSFVVALRRSCLVPADIWRSVSRPFLLSVVIGIGMLAVRVLMPDQSVILRVLSSIIGGATVAIVALVTWSSVKNDLFEILSTLQSSWHNCGPRAEIC